MNIIVLAGGLSPERNVSLSSGSLIASALRRKGHKVLLLDVYVGIEIPNGVAPLSLFTKEQRDEYLVGSDIPDLDELKASLNGQKELIGKNVLQLCECADAVFLALHGDMGENGQLQATLDNFGIKYSGTGFVGSLLAMDKDLSKKLLRAEGILTPDWIYIKADENAISQIEEKIGIPCVIKPCSCGSSVGISIVNNHKELETALEFASKYCENIIVEKMINGKEYTIAILDGKALPAVQIIPKEGFYDYKNKYQKGATTEICPAPMSDELFARLSDITLRGFNCLRLSGYARFDYIMDEDENFYCLEANTLPGMTPTSLLPQEAAAVGIEYDDLCEIIVMLALNKK